MRAFALLALIILLVGCTSGPAASPTPSATPTPTACTDEAKLCPDGSAVGRTLPGCEFAPCPSATPTPSNGSTAVGETVQRGDFEIDIISVQSYPYTSPFGEQLNDYRVDMAVRNTASAAEEYRFAYYLFTGNTSNPVRWYSTLEDQGVLAPGAEATGYVLFDTNGSRGPFQLYVQTLSLTSHDYVDVIGKNTLSKPVAGNRMYNSTCGSSQLGAGYLGSLLGSGACGSITAARDLAIYPIWVEDGVVIVTLKVKNSAESGVDVLIVDEIPRDLGVKAQDLAYTHEPVFLDDYHPAWLVHLSRNEIWKEQMNYSVFLDEAQVSSMNAPAALTVNRG